jgi:two-component system OmpR family sensor kinase
MSSLRARLMLGLLAIAAVGLVIVDAVSYLELRSYLYERVDQQLASAFDPVSRTLIFSPDGSGPAPPPIRGGIPPGLPIPFSGEPPSGVAPAGGPPDELHIPPGTYGVLLGPGKTVKRLPFSYGEKGLPRPELPAQPPVSPGVDSLRPFNVPATSGSSGFRAAAIRFPGTLSGTLVVAIPLGDTDQTLAHVRLIGLIVTAAVLAALAALAWWVIRVGLRPLERMTETANAIAGGDLSHRVEMTDERTEVGRLGVAFNAMLGQIEGALAQREASEERMRRFLADASHELRTPLASIRGYSELFRLGADADPDDLRTAMRRIEDESARMGVLVDDLLTLARLDEVREPRRDRVDLAKIAADAAEDARASAPSRPVKLDIAGAGGTEVRGDPDQLRQVAANLLANAVAHTPDGTPVEVSVTGGEDGVELRVRDHGPGLPDGAAAHVFERFWSERSGETDNGGGSGLGLSIVATVAQAHGGRARAANAPGGGAVFTVALPRRAPVEAEAAAPRS